LAETIRIAIAGASGYIGKALIPRLLEKFPRCEITALSRSQQDSDDPRVVWKACDLFSLKSLEEALPADVDLAFYLVHSMGPTAALDQGSFADYDLILADNFARAIRKTGLRQLIDLGGLIPRETTLSLHLQSRLEVEQTFKEYSLPTTVFRAGLILGDNGSSFQILLKLVKRLPVMLCPKWTQNLTTPIDLVSVLDSIAASALDSVSVGRTYDLAGCRPISYMRMMQETARRLGIRRLFIRVPVFTPTLSRLWVSLITNTSKDLVYPLVESLEHQMVAREDHLFDSGSQTREYFDLLDKATMKTHAGQKSRPFRAQRKTVRSVQRLPLPVGKNAEWVKDQYMQWLPSFLKPLVRVRTAGHEVSFSVLGDRPILLDLFLSPERSTPDRQLLYIIKGLLVDEANRGRLEFREVLNRRFVLAAIHDYRPALPWYIYKYSQAVLHAFVMGAFGRHLKSKGDLEKTDPV
jgi:uncharacterized protein YbjT (DUF2867 family)